MSRDARPVDVVVYPDVSAPYLDADIAASVRRLRRGAEPLDRFRSGSWFATASVRGEVVGCARALPAARAAWAPLSPGLCALGPDRYAEWLAAGLEMTEIVVAAGFRGGGIGAALQRAVLTPAPRRRGWTQLSGRDLAAAGWFRRRGWAVASADPAGAGEVLLDPRHPAVPGIGAVPARSIPGRRAAGGGAPWT